MQVNMTSAVACTDCALLQWSDSDQSIDTQHTHTHSSHLHTAQPRAVVNDIIYNKIISIEYYGAHYHFSWPALTVPCTSFSSEYEYTITHTHSSAQLRQLQCSSISTYLYQLLIAEIPCIVFCSLHARCLRIIYKLPIAEIHSITV